MPAKKANGVRSSKVSKGGAKTSKSDAAHKRKRSASAESTSSSASSQHSTSSAPKQRKTRSRFEDFDVAEAIKHIELPTAPVVAETMYESNAATENGVCETEALRPALPAHEQTASSTNGANDSYGQASDGPDVPYTYDCHDPAVESRSAMMPPVASQQTQEYMEKDRISDEEDSVGKILPAHGEEEVDLNEEMVPLAAIVAVDVDRATEANQGGLLKEPAPPVPNIPRVTNENDGAPPIPTALMELLSA